MEAVLEVNSATAVAAEVCDLRSALEFLKQIPGEYIETDRPVAPVAELTGLGSVADRAQCAARATNGSAMDEMRQALLHFLELDAYLEDQAVPAAP